ncbi:MAG: tetratricopeptide repeat protein [Chlorobiaceae bacterium]|nr:tetratricopeptide repeat protein [Chlorobiaceae bacterium]
MTDVHNQSDIKNQFNNPTLNNPVFLSGENKSKDIPKCIGITPVIPEVFIGRDEELQSVHDALFDGDNLLLLVNGEGGIGKTTLAAKYYQRYFDDYAHLGWVFAERSLGDALLTLADPLKVEFAPTDSADVRREKLLCEMAGLNKPCLLVIDNANELDDLSAHYHELRKCPNFHILLTTRIESFAHARTCRVGHLDEPMAIRLFTTHYPAHDPAEDELLKEVFQAVGYNTLVIELLAKSLDTLNQFRTGYSLAQMLGDLQGSGLFGLSKSAKVQTEYNPGSFGLREEEPEKVIAAMYDLAKLEPGEEQLLCVFSVLPAEAIAFDTLEALQPGNDELDSALRALVRKGWIEYNTSAKQFKCSPVVQAVTRFQVGARLDEQCETLVDALIEKLLYDPSTGHLLNTDYLSGALYARYAESVVEYFESPRHEIAGLNERIGMFYRTTGQLDKALTFFEECNQLSEKLSKANPDNVSFKHELAISYSKLGETFTTLGQLEKALTFFEKFNLLIKELYEANPANVSFKNGLAISYSKLGETYTTLGQLEKALTFFEKATKLSEELYEANPANVSFKYGLAASYDRLGGTYGKLGQLDKALTFFEKETDLFEELYETNPANVTFKNGLAISYEKLGETYTTLGQLDKALTFFEKYNHLREELYEANPANVSFKNGLAISYEKLGETYTTLGQLDKALSFFEKCNQLSEELYKAHPENVSFKNGLAVSCIKLGGFNLFQQKDKAQARRWFEKAEVLWAELVNDCPAYAEFQNNWAAVKNILAAL